MEKDSARHLVLGLSLKPKLLRKALYGFFFTGICCFYSCRWGPKKGYVVLHVRVISQGVDSGCTDTISTFRQTLLGPAANRPGRQSLSARRVKADNQHGCTLAQSYQQACASDQSELAHLSDRIPPTRLGTTSLSFKEIFPRNSITMRSNIHGQVTVDCAEQLRPRQTAGDVRVGLGTIHRRQQVGKLEARQPHTRAGCRLPGVKAHKNVRGMGPVSNED